MSAQRTTYGRRGIAAVGGRGDSLAITDLFVAGSEVGPTQANRPFVYRLSSGGELDSSFGTKGFFYLDRRGDVGGGALGLATRRGKVLVVAYRDLATSSRQLTLVAWLQG